MPSILEALSLVGEAELIIVKIAITICDMIGVAVLMTTVIKSVINYFHKDRHVKLVLAQGIALALEFKLAGEVLRTVTVRDWNELVILGAIIVLRGAITVLIHWEIKAEKNEQEQNYISVEMLKREEDKTVTR